MRAMTMPSRKRSSSSAAWARSSPGFTFSPHSGQRYESCGTGSLLKKLQRCRFQMLIAKWMRVVGPEFPLDLCRRGRYQERHDSSRMAGGGAVERDVWLDVAGAATGFGHHG